MIAIIFTTDSSYNGESLGEAGGGHCFLDYLAHNNEEAWQSLVQD